MSEPSFFLWPAPAKLNLMLRVVGRRNDGYHLLQTVFQFLDFGDSLEFSKRSDGVVSRVSELHDVPAEDDLVVRAAKMLQREARVADGVDISMHKQIPMGGGLGGGSSDAATTLVALNHIWECGLTRDQLAELGVALGADVPIFVHGFAAWAEGIGERLTPIEPPQPWYLVLKPACHVPTAAVFSDPDLTRDAPQTTIRAFLAGEGGNSCLQVVRKQYPEVRQAIEWLEQFSEPKLTGTGACIFAEFASEAEARSVAGKLPGHIQGFVAKGVNRSPLNDYLEQNGISV